MSLKKYLDYDGLAYLLQRFPKTTVHCTFESGFAGETATLTHGTTTYTKTVPATSPFELTFAVNELGTWTLQSSYLGTQYSDTVDITYLGQKGEIELTIVPDGSIAEPINSIPVWLKCANLNKSYTTLEEILADTETYETLLADSNACQYLKRSTGWALAEGVVPVMTSDTQPSGTVIYSSVDESGTAYKAFDGNDNTSWSGAGGTSSDAYIGYIFTSAKCIIRADVLDDKDAKRIRTFKIEGSNDGTSWTDVSGTLELTGSETKIKTFLFDNSNYYTQYRLHTLTTVSNYNPHCATLQFYDQADITHNQDAMARLGKFDYASNLLISDSTWCEAIANSDYFEEVLNVKVPKMTSDTTPSGVAYVLPSNAGSGYEAYRAFDGNSSTMAAATGTRPYRLGYQFTQPVNVKKVVAYSNYTGSTGILRASNDNSTWKEIKILNHDSQTKEYIITENSEAFTYWEIESTQEYSWGSFDMYSLQFYGRASEEVLVPLVPTMTSNTTPSGECITSGSDAYKAFDGNDSTYASMSYANDAYVGYHSTSAKIVNKIAFIADPSDACVFAIDGSNDGTNWTEIDTITGSTSTLKYADITNNTAYSYHRLRIKQKGSESWSGFIVKTLQFYERTVQTNIIHSAPNDTIYMLEDGDPIILATTNSDGDGILDFSQLSAGPVTLYSSVAKNPDDLTADYSKTIMITKTQYGGTTEAYLRPSTIGMLYWFGYSDPMVGSLESMNSAAGWNFWNNPFNNASWLTNYINITTTNTANQTCGVGNVSPVDSKFYNKFKYIMDKRQGQYGSTSNVTKVQANSSTSAAHSYHISTPVTGLGYYEFDYEKDLYVSVYTFRPNASGAVPGIVYLYAWWYTNESE